MSHQSALGRPQSGKKRIKDLLARKDNRLCADCGAPDPKWASANIGVFICLKCCGVHRSLGSHVSKVLSVTLDEWSDEEIDAMIEVGGNASANSIYEAYLPEGVSKPRPDAPHEVRAKFIKSKYERQEFLKPSLRITSGGATKHSLQASFSRKIFDSFQSSSSSKNSTSMEEFIGTLKIKVLKGTNLAVRDMLSSDPYIILTLGKQKVQTSVVSSNLNPVWNEELKLKIPQDFGSIKLDPNGSIHPGLFTRENLPFCYPLFMRLDEACNCCEHTILFMTTVCAYNPHISPEPQQVYDHDMFSADDIMGEAEIDIQPMITSAMAFGDAGMFSDMQIGKWLKSYDNALIEDSPVNIVDGKVKQDLWLRLQNVESGEVELELEWAPIAE